MQIFKNFVVLTILAVIIATAPYAHALTPEEIVNYRGADRQQVLVDGARKEGQVVLYSALIVNQMLRPLAAGFMKRYPFIKMTYYRADSEELLAKLSAETRASNVVADVFEGSGGGEIAVDAGFTQAFYSPELDSYPKMYLDPKGHLAPTRLSYFSIAYNAKQVAPDRVPKTYEDLTDPYIWDTRPKLRCAPPSLSSHINFVARADGQASEAVAFMIESFSVILRVIQTSIEDFGLQPSHLGGHLGNY